MTLSEARKYLMAVELRAAAATHPHSCAIRHGERSITYADLADLADRCASRLATLDIGVGERIFVLSRSPIEVFALAAAAAQTGAVIVPANWRLSAPEMAGILTDSNARCIFVDRDLAPALPTGDPSMVILDDWLAWLGEGRPLELRPTAPHEAALQIYTSGTSGQPKGVVLTHGNLAEKVLRMGERWELRPSSVSLLATPLFHIGGLSWGLVSLAARAELVVPVRISIDEIDRLIDEERATHAFLVPKLLNDLVAQRETSGREDCTLDVVLCGAAPVSVELQRRAATSLGCRVLQVYGMTETTGGITELDATAALCEGDPEYVLSSSGAPYPWVQIDIRDPEDQSPVPCGSPGEIWTRSEQNCAGYWNRPAETLELLVDGWLRTGDGGFLDETGRLHITDRLKDMVVSGGENIYSIEVERALLTHPAVRDVAVVGLPDADWGEVVVAVIEQHPGVALTLNEASEHVGRLLGRYKRPRQLFVVDKLPRNSNGKVLKHRVRSLIVSTPTKEPS